MIAVVASIALILTISTVEVQDPAPIGIEVSALLRKYKAGEVAEMRPDSVHRDGWASWNDSNANGLVLLYFDLAPNSRKVSTSIRLEPYFDSPREKPHRYSTSVWNEAHLVRGVKIGSSPNQFESVLRANGRRLKYSCFVVASGKDEECVYMRPKVGTTSCYELRPVFDNNRLVALDLTLGAPAVEFAVHRTTLHPLS